MRNRRVPESDGWVGTVQHLKGHYRTGASAKVGAASEASVRRRMAEREGFEPPCRLPGKTLSRRPRYDHFGTSPLLTSLGGAPFHSPPRCALAAAFGDCPPALACGRRRFLNFARWGLFTFPTSLRARGRLRRLPSGARLRPQALL